MNNQEFGKMLEIRTRKFAVNIVKLFCCIKIF